MASIFASCFGSAHPKSEALVPEDPERQRLRGSAGQRGADNVNPAKCIFCNVTPAKFSIVLEDVDYICFRDRSPAAAQHLLVIPRKHIANVQSLTAQHVDLVKEMQVLGDRALDLSSPQGASQDRRFGFHIPPFRSVDHLHLHCIEEPFRSSLRALKYRIASPPSPKYHKGWSWFAERKQTCAILQDDAKVTISSC